MRLYGNRYITATLEESEDKGMRTRLKTKRNKPIHLLLKFAALIILFLLSVSVFGEDGTNSGEVEVDMSELSAAKDAGPAVPEGTVLWKLGQHDGSAAEFTAVGSNGAKGYSALLQPQ